MLIDDGVIDIDDEVWHVDLSQLDPGAVPTSLTASCKLVSTRCRSQSERRCSAGP
jgi:hypothetical protein